MIKQNKGFTIIEILIVISLISIVALFAVPAFQDWLKGYRLNDGVQQIKSAIMLAKMTSVKQGQPVLVEFKTGEGSDGWYCVFTDDGGGDSTLAGNGVWDSGENVFRQGNMPEGVALYKAEFLTAIASNGKRSAYFNPRGLPMGVDLGMPVYFSGQVYVSANNAYRRVNTSAGGSIFIEKNTVAEGGTWSE